MDNWLVAVVAGAFLLGLIIGIARGAIKITVSILATIVTFVLVFFLTPYVSKGITKMTPAQDVLETKIESTIAGMVMGDSEEGGTNKEDQIRNALKAAGVDEDRLNELGITVEDIANGDISKNDLAEMGISRNILDGINQQSADNGTESPENIEIPRDMQISAIENADIPSVFKNLLLTNNNSEIYDKLGVTGFVSYVSAYMAKLIINVAAFLLTFIVVSIILRAIIFSLNVVSEFSTRS